jgi:HTH-type transcriptional regulator/antitoxin HigA
MAIRRTKAPPRRVQDTYLDLIHQWPLRPIRSEAELDRATAVLNSLLDRDRLDHPEQDYLDVLGDLIERYEDEAHLINTSDLTDAEMLAHLIEAKGVNQAAVARSTGIAVSTISEVLAGKRQLSRRHIDKLAAYFHVGVSAFGLPGSQALMRPLRSSAGHED